MQRQTPHIILAEVKALIFSIFSIISLLCSSCVCVSTAWLRLFRPWETSLQMKSSVQPNTVKPFNTSGGLSAKLWIINIVKNEPHAVSSWGTYSNSSELTSCYVTYRSEAAGSSLEEENILSPDDADIRCNMIYNCHRVTFTAWLKSPGVCLIIHVWVYY